MFQHKIIGKDIYIFLPETMNFDLKFHRQIAALIYFVLQFNKKYEIHRLTFKCTDYVNYAKMSKAYLYNILEYFKEKNISVYIDYNFKKNVVEPVHKKLGKTYKDEININSISDIAKKDLSYYLFKGDKDIHKPVEDIVKTISSLSLMLNKNELQDFLITTIGEIFSNSINHSEQDEVRFLFNIAREKNNFYLYVSTIDYGRTIISNVQNFLNDKQKSSSDCMAWAIKEGNTTRKGSGGYGLDMLINYIKAAKGSLIILSGNAHYSLTPDNKAYINDSPKELFTGTSVTFKIELLSKDILSYKDGTIRRLSLNDL